MNVTAQVRVLYGQDARVLTGKAVPARLAIKINDVEIPFALDSFAEDQRIPKMVAGIQKEDAKPGHDTHRHMQQRHALRLE